MNDRPFGDWRPSAALRRVIGLVCLLLIGAVAAGRPDLAVLALPLAAGAAWSLKTRPYGLPRVTLEVPETRVGEGDATTAAVTVANDTGAEMDPAVVVSATSRWLDVPDADRPLAAVVPPGRAADLTLRVEALRWGRHRLGPARVRLAACGGLLVSPELIAEPTEIRVHPVNESFEADEAMPRASGLAGTHRSHRPGEGGELVGVRRYAPGDRLRRIDWRVSLRTRQLHVAATLSDREAEVVLVLDTLHEAGVSGGVRGAASALDIAVRGSAAVAEHYLRRGDRVSLLEFGPRHRQLRPASSRWQYQVVREWLLDTHVVPGMVDPAMWLSRPHLLPPNALLVAFTPLLDERSAQLLARLARAGRFLIAVDTLPPDAGPDIDSEWLEAATRFWRLARRNTIDELREHGVPVVAWRGSGSLDEVLRDVSKMALAGSR